MLSSKSRGNLSRLVVKPHFTLGTLVHHTLARWALDPESNPVDIFKSYSVKHIRKLRQSFYDFAGKSIKEEELDNIYRVVGLGISMMRQYHEYWGQPLPKGYFLVQPEQQFEIPIPDTEHFLTGRLDAVVRDDNGLLYILENKTYSRVPTDHYLKMADQFVAYRWILEKMNIGPVKGVLYNGIEKTEYTDRCKRPLSSLFCRKLIVHTPSQVKEFEIFLTADVKKMYSADIKTTNRRWEGCDDCDYDPLCTAISLDEDYEYIRSSLYGPRDKLETTYEE